MSRKVEYGDFQTPQALADAVCGLLRGKGLAPASIVEPTCGEGNFVVSALQAFPEACTLLALDVNLAHLETLRQRIAASPDAEKVEIRQGDFFDQDWPTLVYNLEEPMLIVGNPPWVTNATLGKLQGTNLPRKSNFQRHRGIEALTGKSNFDISEPILTGLLEAATGKEIVLAVLCKLAVARKVIASWWRKERPAYRFTIYPVDALQHFGVSVAACLLVAETAPEDTLKTCPVYTDLERPEVKQVLGYTEGTLLADAERYRASRALIGSSAYVWRSGVKHDCAAVMELEQTGPHTYRNKLGDTVSLEDTYLYPLLKGSDVAKGHTQPRRYVLLPQPYPGAPTAPIQNQAPATWRYLQAHAPRLQARRSSIYRNQPPFSIFGIGPYSFAPWKVAISGLYKHLQFTLVGPSSGRPVMLDDTCYFVPCATKEEGRLLKALLDAPETHDLFAAFIFWDEKRPITRTLLQRLDLSKVAQRVGRAEAYRKHVMANPYLPA